MANTETTIKRTETMMLSSETTMLNTETPEEAVSATRTVFSLSAVLATKLTDSLRALSTVLTTMTSVIMPLSAIRSDTLADMPTPLDPNSETSMVMAMAPPTLLTTPPTMTGTVNPSTTTTTILRPLTTMRVATEVSGTTTSVETTTTTTPTTVLDRTTPAVPTDSDTPTATWAPLEVSSSANTAVKTSVTMAQLASADTTVDSLMLTTALALWARATATSLKRVATLNSTL